jgi:hypothetical protein
MKIFTKYRKEECRRQPLPDDETGRLLSFSVNLSEGYKEKQRVGRILRPQHGKSRRQWKNSAVDENGRRIKKKDRSTTVLWYMQWPGPDCANN